MKSLFAGPSTACECPLSIATILPYQQIHYKILNEIGFDAPKCCQQENIGLRIFSLLNHTTRPQWSPFKMACEIN